LAYIKPYKWLVLVSLLFGAVGQVCLMLDPHFLGIIIDKYAANPQNADYNGVLYYLGLMLAVSIAGGLAKVFQDYFVKAVVQKLGARLYTDGVRQLLKLPYPELEEERSGEAISILQQAETDAERFTHAIINNAFSILVSVIFVCIYSINIHWAILPVYVIGVAILVVLAGILSRRIKYIQQSVVREMASLAGSVTESLRNISLVKSLGLTRQEEGKFSTNTNKILSLRLQNTRNVRRFNIVQGAFIYVLRMATLFTLLWLVFRTEVSAGKLVTLTFYANLIFAPFHGISFIVVVYRETQASLENFKNLMSKIPEPILHEATQMAGITELRFKDVSFRHKTSQQLTLSGISFGVKQGETIAFAGPSGAGKTTMVKLLLGLYKPQTGDILYNGVNARDINIDSLRTQIGLVTQDPQLFAGTIKENLLFANPHASDEEVKQALNKAGCSKLILSNKGIETMIGEGGLKLSGGEKQRVAIARALLRHPRMLIFDEATSALDSLTEEEVASAIRDISLQRERITILIAHRLSTIIHADRIYVLEKGNITETGTHDTLLAEKGLYYAMWRQQIGENVKT